MTHPLRAFRESFTPHLTQEELGERLGGLRRATISRWESGERFPDRKLWPRIEAVTGVTPEQLSGALRAAA
jgi:transcriptional regulator with XRE-family HTH domain